MEFQEGSVGIPQKGAGPVEFTLYLAPRSVIDLRLEVTASLSELNPNPAPCTPIVQSVELISIGHYIGYPDYENFGMEECESWVKESFYLNFFDLRKFPNWEHEKN